MKKKKFPRRIRTSSKFNKEKHNMEVFYKIWKKYDEIQLTKKMDLNNRKMKNHPLSTDATSCNSGRITQLT